MEPRPTPEPTSIKERWLAMRLQRWARGSAWLSSGLLGFLTLSGLGVTFLPFSALAQHALLVHTAIGLLALLPLGWFLARHVRDYWSHPLSHVKFTGWCSGAMTVVCVLSGVVLTGEGVLGTRITYAWRLTHLLSTFGLVLFVVPHLGALYLRERRRAADPLAEPALAAMRRHGNLAFGALLLGVGATLALTAAVPATELSHGFPADYDRATYEGAGPFAPSLARTTGGEAIHPNLLGGSATCGTSGCHEEIYAEWLPSAHRYAAMDPVFQKIQSVMASQNGPVSTRYCAGCHDPISLFEGSKDFGVPELTGRAGFDEGVSCLACHGIEETDVKGNASYVMGTPERYVWELRGGALARALRDFTMRTYPDHHAASLSRQMFKTPEFCAACHKQFIDEEVNRVGWVQLQNQYDNWKASRYNHPGDAHKTLECRECHMPLVDSADPARGDAADFNRHAGDKKHRSHRFLGANQFIPKLLDLPGADEHVALTEAWLRGEHEVPEIAERWSSGPVVPIELHAPESVTAGEEVALRVHLLNNKAGHDFPTGPLDIIQAWIELRVTDPSGEVVFHTGATDERHAVQTGTYMFKAEPVDRYGNLIDRHNLWEMVGVRFRRSLFPGAAEVARFDFPCPAAEGPAEPSLPGERSVEVRIPAVAAEYLDVEAKLNYRKVDQFLFRFAFGEDTTLASPTTTISTARARIRVLPAAQAHLLQTPAGGDGGGGR